MHIAIFPAQFHGCTQRLHSLLFSSTPDIHAGIEQQGHEVKQPVSQRGGRGMQLALLNARTVFIARGEHTIPFCAVD